MIRSMWKLTLGLLTAAVVGAGMTANAAFTVTVNTILVTDNTSNGADPNTPTSFSDQNTLGGSIRLGDTTGFISRPTLPNGIQVGFTAVSNQAGTPSVSTTNVFLANTSASTQRITLLLRETTFTLGGGGPTSLSNTVTVNSNPIFTTAGGFTLISAVSNFNTAGMSGTPVVTNNVPNSTVTFNRTLTNFGLDQTITFDLAGNANLLFSNSATLVPVPLITPVPATALAALAALPVLGLGLRRRMKTVTA